MAMGGYRGAIGAIGWVWGGYRERWVGLGGPIGLQEAYRGRYRGCRRDIVV